MTKQEEINMTSLIPQVLNKMFTELLIDYDTYKTGQGDEPLDFYIGKAITKTIHELHDNGVVIKVERESPEAPSGSPFDEYLNGYYQAIDDMEGYVAVEPLIKEVQPQI